MKKNNKFYIILLLLISSCTPKLLRPPVIALQEKVDLNKLHNKSFVIYNQSNLNDSVTTYYFYHLFDRKTRGYIDSQEKYVIGDTISIIPVGKKEALIFSYK
jgi:hypothetical protein